MWTIEDQLGHMGYWRKAIGFGQEGGSMEPECGRWVERSVRDLCSVGGKSEND